MVKNATQVNKQRTRWISVREASERVPWTYKYLLKIIKAGKLPAGIAHRPMPGSNWIIDVDAFDRWIENGCFTVAPGQDDGGKVADRSLS